MNLPPPASTIKLSDEPIAAAIQAVAVLTYPKPAQSQRAAQILKAWHYANARAAGIERTHPGMSPARIEERLQPVAKLLDRRFDAARWAIMVATRDTSIKIRIGAAEKATVRALAERYSAAPQSTVIRDVWTASKPVLAMTLAILGQFDDEPTLEDLCFHSHWVRPAVSAAEFIAWWLESWPALQYRASDRIAFAVPNLISGEPLQSK